MSSAADLSERGEAAPSDMAAYSGLPSHRSTSSLLYRDETAGNATSSGGMVTCSGGAVGSSSSSGGGRRGYSPPLEAARKTGLREDGEDEEPLSRLSSEAIAFCGERGSLQKPGWGE